MDEKLKIKVGDEWGWLFEGELPGTLCFVPARFLDDAGVFDEVAYAGSFWSGANLGALPEELGIGSQLFPAIELGPLAHSPEHDAFLSELGEIARFRKGR